MFLDAVRSAPELCLCLRCMRGCVACLAAATFARLERRCLRVRLDTAQVAQLNLRSRVMKPFGNPFPRLAL